MRNINKYDIVCGIVNKNNDDSIQAGKRPMIVISNNLNNKYAPTIMVLPLTSKKKKLNMPTHYLLKPNKENGLTHYSTVLAEQITTVNKNKVKKIGEVKDRKDQKMIFKCFILSSAFKDDDYGDLCITENE